MNLVKVSVSEIIAAMKRAFRGISHDACDPAIKPQTHALHEGGTYLDRAAVGSKFSVGCGEGVCGGLVHRDV
jgi:hypothetical protein